MSEPLTARLACGCRLAFKAGSPGSPVTVMVERRFRDPVYGKYVKSRRKYHAHDEKEEFKQHDLVEITESRPLSATKRWVVTKLITRPEEV